ncbi:DUF945 family protein [Sulfurimonas sp.]|uniref:DUF945 family protein n=1 Tax=Sulfurimonas sp. TaxID=2022749 RepID=UPI003D0E7EB1
MKKITIIAVLVVGALAALPIIGNQYVNSTMNERIEELKTHGVGVKNSSQNSSYLTSSKHYEFILDDGAKFIDFLNQYATSQIPPYVDSVINGVVVGVDVEYSNIPFFSTVAVDIYPMDFSQQMMDSLKRKDTNFYDQLNTFLGSKGINYHINYHLGSEQFDGYIKDIDQTFNLNDGTVLNLALNDTKFDGEGELIAPKSSNFTLGKMKLNVTAKNNKLVFALEDFKGSSAFASKATYDTDINAKNFKFVLDEKYNDVYFDLNDIKGKFSSDDKGEKTKIFGDTYFKDMTIKGSDLDLVMKEFKYALSVEKLDKDLFAKLQELISKNRSNMNYQAEQEIEKTVADLLSKGLELNVKNISVDEVVYNKNKEYKNLSFNALVNFKEDPDLATKLKRMPMEALQNIDMNSEFIIPKNLYEEIDQTGEIAQYAQIDGDKVTFKSEFKDGKLSVNGKPVR